jgi:two-component system CheB/CheR fusion protein
VLIVDDRHDSRRALARLLEAEVYRVVTVHSGSEALAAAAASPVDVLVSDISLPDFDGCELLRRLRDLYRRDVPAVAITGHGEGHHIEACRRAGYSQVLLKPVAFKDVLESLRALIPA